MNKQDKRTVMGSLSGLNVSDEQALSFIKDLADYQMFKAPRAYEKFCVDCAIIYTGQPSTLLRKMETTPPEEIHKWREDFIDKCSYFKLVNR